MKKKFEIEKWKLNVKFNSSLKDIFISMLTEKTYHVKQVFRLNLGKEVR